MKYINAIMVFCYVFVLGVAIPTIFQFPQGIYIYCYIVSAILAAVGLSLIVLTDVFELFELPRWTIMLVVAATALSLGMGRFIHNKIIPPFIDNPDVPNHILHFVDKDRNDKTLVVGIISAEPEVRFDPYERTELTIRPEVVVPQPGAPEYLVGDGYIKVTISPDIGPLYRKLARSDAYGYRIQVEGSLLRYNPTTVPYTLDLRNFWENQNMFAQMKFYRLKDNSEIQIINDEKTGEPRKGGFLPELALKIKDNILRVTKLTTPYPYSAFLAGVTLGLRRGLEPAYSIFVQDKKYKERSDKITEEFRWSGTSHVLAVSGLHVTIITIMFYAIFATFRIPKRYSAPIIVLALIIFTIITGGRPSTVRATIMNSLVVLSDAYLGMGLKTSLLFGIGVAGFAQLVRNPKLLFEPAFTLSFMAVISLGLITGPADRFLQKNVGKRTLGAIMGFYVFMIAGSFLPGAGPMIAIFIGTVLGIIYGVKMVKFIPRWLMQFISAQFAIQFGMMLPLSALYFNHLPVAGPVANVVAIPLIGIIVQLGMLAGIVGMIIPKIGIFIALLMNATNYLCIWLFMFVVHWSKVTMPYPYMKAFTQKCVTFYYAFLFLLLFIDKKYPDIEVWYYRKLAQGVKNLKYKFIAGVLIGLLVIFGLPAVIWKEPFQKYDGKLQINFLDVGYGSAIHIRTPKGKNFLVNGGRYGKYDRNGGFDLADFRIIPYFLQQRIGVLDGVFITSLNDEDISGLVSVVRKMLVDKVYTFFDSSNIPLKSRRDEYAKKVFRKLGDRYLLSKIDKATIRNKAAYYRDIMFQMNQSYYPFGWFNHLAMSPTKYLKELFFIDSKNPELVPVGVGDIIYEETYKGKDLTIYIMNPDWKHPLKNSDDNSMVIKIEYGKTGIILLNSVKKYGEAKLSRFKSNLKADVMQVSSHGSKDASSKLILRLIKPKIALLEFGYPRQMYKSAKQKAMDAADFTTAKLQRLGANVLRTDKAGTVMIISDGEKILEPITFKGTLSTETAIEDLSGAESLKEF